MGLDVELISPERASRLNPFLKPTGVVAAMRIGDDRYFDPAQVAIGYARGAAARGATLLAFVLGGEVKRDERTRKAASHFVRRVRG